MTGQTLIVMGGALLLMVSTLRLVRLRLLSIRYGIGWLLVAVLGIVGSPILTLIVTRLDLFGFTPTGFSLGVFIAFLGLVSLQLSVSLSGLHRAMQDLAEHSAHVEARVRRLEGARVAEPQPMKPKDRVGT
ncbi:MAG: hypothetical protein JWO90_1183 [Solirubrobacterales bacterium]|jgi:uncharacterized membrane protein YeaQ/YmgE (transglycosylase-associated protein family)|nr:hypothetical protein [Solirubrobacterales bacterium]